MIDLIEFGSEFFAELLAIDKKIVERVAKERCPKCGGPLCRSDYPRKPRWGALPEVAGAFAQRFSVCCGREGCRRRVTPPSVRFMGRRVYAGAVVVLASALAVMVMMARATASMSARTRAPAVSGVPARTVRRWLGWWQGPFTSTASFLDILSRIVPSPERGALPASLLERLGTEAREQVGRLLLWIAPEGTKSCPDGSRLLRDVR